jgi:hypothetical protein
MDDAIRRSVFDIQSKISSLDHRLLRMSAGAPAEPRPGRAFFLMAEASLAHFRGHHAPADSLVQRAAVAPAQTTVSGWASELVASPVGQLLLWIRKQSAYAAIAARTQAFEIENEVMPRLVVGGEIVANFVAEGLPAGVAKSTLTPLTLAPRKIVGIATLTEELLYSGTNVAAVLQQLLSNGVATALDTAFFGTAALSAAAPAGILNGISPLVASVATPVADAARADLRALVAALDPATDPVFVMAPARALWLSTVLPPGFSIPVLTSTVIPAARVICIDAAGLVAAHGANPRFATSRSAALHESDVASPLSASGTPNVVAAPLRSLLQTDSLAIRAILYATWAARAGAVAYVDAGW